MTPFDEEEERRRWEFSGMSPALGAGQGAATDVAAEAMRWLGSRGMPQQQEAPAMQMPSIPEPPEASTNTGGLIAAAIADLVLNKGRSMGTLIGHHATSSDQVAKENWMRKRQHALDTAQMQRMAGSGRDPREIAIAQGHLAARQRELDQAERRMMGVGGPEALTPAERLARERFEWEKDQAGKPKPPPEMTPYQRAMLDNSAAARSDAAEAKGEATYSKQAREFEKDSGDYLSLGQSVRAADDLTKKYPKDIPGVGEYDRFKMDNDLPFVGAGEEGVQARKTLDLLREKFRHAQTGAAGSVQEMSKLERLAAGLNSSNELEVRAAIGGIREYAQSRLNAKRTGREEAADDVIRNAGLGGWLPQQDASRETPGATAPGAIPGQNLGVTSGRVPGINDGPKPPATGMVQMRDPRTGVTKMVPAQNVEAARARGLEVVQ